MKSTTVLLALSVAALIALAWLFATYIPSEHLPSWIQLLVAVVFVALTVWNFTKLRIVVNAKKEMKKSARPYILIISGFIVIGASFCWLFIFPEVLPRLEFWGPLIGIGAGILLGTRGLIPKR